MPILMLALCGVMDTLELPEPAAAIFTTTEGKLGYLSRAGEEILIKEEEGWKKFPLPERFLLTERILVKGTLCYILAGRTLRLFDLRTSRKAVIAEDVDDAAINRYGELWVLSAFKLRRLSPLGRELEIRKLKTLPRSVWITGDSLYLADKEMPLLDEKMTEELKEAGVTAEQLAPSQLALHGKGLYVLLDSRRVLRVLRVLRVSTPEG